MTEESTDWFQVPGRAVGVVRAALEAAQLVPLQYAPALRALRLHLAGMPAAQAARETGTEEDAIATVEEALRSYPFTAGVFAADQDPTMAIALLCAWEADIARALERITALLGDSEESKRYGLLIGALVLVETKYPGGVLGFAFTLGTGAICARLGYRWGLRHRHAA